MIKSPRIFIVNPLDNTDSAVLKCHYTKDNELVIAGVSKTSAFIAKETPATLFTFYHGLSYLESDIIAWAKTNNYSVLIAGVDSGAPFLVSAALNGGKTVVTLTFSKNIANNTANNAALKALVTIATNGTTFNALGGSDTVSTPDGTGKVLTVTFNAALSTATNKIRVGAAALKDASGNTNPVQTSSTINAS